MPLHPAAQKLLQDVDKKLHEENEVTKMLAQIETRTGVKRLHLVLGQLFSIWLFCMASKHFFGVWKKDIFSKLII